LFGSNIHGRRFKTLVHYFTDGALFLVCCKRKDSRNFEWLIVVFLQLVQFFIITFGCIHTANGEHGVKASIASLGSMRFYPEILYNVLRYFFDTLRMK